MSEQRIMARAATSAAPLVASAPYNPMTGTRTSPEDISLLPATATPVAGLNADYKIVPMAVTMHATPRLHPVTLVTTRSGRRTTLTDVDAFLTVEGWASVLDLEAGARVAAPRGLPTMGARMSLPDNEVFLLGVMTGDGGLADPKSVPTFNCAKGSPLLDMVRDAVAPYGVTPKKSPASEVTWRLSGDGFHRGNPNPCTEMLRRHDMIHHARDKRVPAAIFPLPLEQIALFLRGAFATDGWISTQNRRGGVSSHVGYCTISHALALDIQHLLLRFGILSRVVDKRRTVYEGTSTRAWDVRVTDHSSLCTFVDQIGAYSKEAAVERLSLRNAQVSPNTNVDTIPRSVWTRVEAVKGDMSWNELARRLGYSDIRKDGQNKPGGLLKRKTRDLGRARLAHVADVVGCPDLRNLSRSDIFWDEVALVEHMGEREIWHLSVPVGTNFIADDLFIKRWA